jgi:hypothetical protein
MDLAARYSTGTTVVWWGFSSCMKKSNLLEKRLFLNKTGKRTLFIITCYSGKDIHRHSMYEGEGEVLLPPACQFNILNSIDKGNGLRIIEFKEIQPIYDYSNAFLSQTDISTNAPLYNIHFQPISTVSLSKKSLPVALPNVHLEEHIAYIKQRSKVGLKSMTLTDSDMDIVVSEIIMKKQCSELDLSTNKITYNGALLLAHVLRKNKVRDIVYFIYSIDSGRCLLKTA